MSDPRVRFHASNEKAIQKSMEHTGQMVQGASKCKLTAGESKKLEAVMARTVAGLYFLKKASKQYVVHLFISIYDIISIETGKAYVLKYGSRPDSDEPLTAEVKCSTFEQEIGYTLQQRCVLGWGDPAMKPITWIGPNKPAIREFIEDRPEALATMRYCALCGKDDVAPDSGVSETFIGFDNSPRTTFYINGFVKTPYSYRHISEPLCMEPHLSVVKFVGFAPLIIGQIVNELVTRSKSLTTLCLENYSDFKFEQIDFEQMHQPSLVSLHLVNVMRDVSNRFDSLVRRLAGYMGDFQQLTLSEVPMTKVLAEHLSVVLGTEHCFRTLEYLALKKLVVKDGEGKDVFDSLLTVGTAMPCLFRLSVKGIVRYVGTEPDIRVKNVEIPVNILDPEKPFALMRTTVMSALRSCQFQNLDFSNVVSGWELPIGVFDFSFPSCRFNSKSLIGLLTAIGSHGSRISLGLKDVKMSVAEWTKFWKALSGSEPITNLCELDWSGNTFVIREKDSETITMSNEVTFCEKLLSRQSLRYLTLSRTCEVRDLDRLLKILEYLRKSSLWGIRIRGESRNFRYEGALKGVVTAVLSISTLTHMDVCDHDLNDEDASELAQLPQMKTRPLDELFIDKTVMSQDAFFHFYEAMKRRVRSVVGVPLWDIGSRPAGPLFTLGDWNLVTSPLLDLRNYWRNGHRITAKTQRIRFYDTSIDMTADMRMFTDEFPVTCLPIVRNDMYGVGGIPITNHRPKIIRNGVMEEVRGMLGDSLVGLLPSPYGLPPGEPDADFDMPERMRACAGMKFEVEGGSVRSTRAMDQERAISKWKGYMRPEFLGTLRAIQLINKTIGHYGKEHDCETSLRHGPPIFITPGELKHIRERCEKLGVRKSAADNTSRYTQSSMFSGTKTPTSIRATHDDDESDEENFDDTIFVLSGKVKILKAGIQGTELTDPPQLTQDKSAVVRGYDVNNMEETAHGYHDDVRHLLQRLRASGEKLYSRLNDSAGPPLPCEPDVHDDYSIHSVESKTASDLLLQRHSADLCVLLA